MHLRLVFLRQQHGNDEVFRFAPQAYLRMDGDLPKGPADFAWSEEQLDDLATLFQAKGEEGPRQRLGEAQARLLQGLSLRLEHDTFDEADAHGAEVTLSVSSAAAELYALPWEITAVGSEGMYLSDYRSVLVRYTVPGLEAPPPTDTPADPRVLLAWSAAGGAVPYGAHAASLQAAAERGGIAYETLDHVNEAALCDALEAKPPTVLHLLCHGAPPANAGEPPALLWGDGQGGKVTVTAARLARILRPYRRHIRMVLLCVCGGGDGRIDAMFVGSLAQELHRKGINNVVASRYLLSVAGSRVLVTALYDKLLAEGWSLERALRYARAELFRPDEDGNSHPGDAYGLQLYAHARERFISDNGVEAERPLLSTYPFGKADNPTPLAKPPRVRVRLKLATALKRILPLVGKLIDKLLALAEDPTMRLLSITEGSTVLYLDTTVDGAQRLLDARRQGVLDEQLGHELLDMRLFKDAIPPSVQTPSTAWLGAKSVPAPSLVASAEAARAGVAGAEVGTAMSESPKAVRTPAGSTTLRSEGSKSKSKPREVTLGSAVAPAAAHPFEATLESGDHELPEELTAPRPANKPAVVAAAAPPPDLLPARVSGPDVGVHATSPWAKPRRSTRGRNVALGVLLLAAAGVALALSRPDLFQAGLDARGAPSATASVSSTASAATESVPSPTASGHPAHSSSAAPLSTPPARYPVPAPRYPVPAPRQAPPAAPRAPSVQPSQTATAAPALPISAPLPPPLPPAGETPAQHGPLAPAPQAPQ